MNLKIEELKNDEKIKNINYKIIVNQTGISNLYRVDTFSLANKCSFMTQLYHSCSPAPNLEQFKVSQQVL